MIIWILLQITNYTTNINKVLSKADDSFNMGTSIAIVQVNKKKNPSTSLWFQFIL